MIDSLIIKSSEFRDYVSILVKEQVMEILSTPGEQRKRYLTRQEAAEALNVSFVTLNIWDKKSILKPTKVEGRLYYDKLKINELLNGGAK